MLGQLMPHDKKPEELLHLIKSPCLCQVNSFSTEYAHSKNLFHFFPQSIPSCHVWLGNEEKQTEHKPHFAPSMSDFELVPCGIQRKASLFRSLTSWKFANMVMSFARGEAQCSSTHHPKMLAFYQASLTLPELVPGWNHLWPRGDSWPNISCWLLWLREEEALTRQSLPCVQPPQLGGAPTTQSSECMGTDIEPQAQASLVVQRLKVCLPMQETWFNSWSVKIPRAMGQLRPRATTNEVWTL